MLLEEGEAGAPRRADQIRVLDALVGQLFANHRGAAQEDADVLSLVLLAVLLEDATPVGAAKELPCGARELLDLGQLDLTSQEERDLHNAHSWTFGSCGEQITEPVELFLTTADPVEVDLLGDHHQLVDELFEPGSFISHCRGVASHHCAPGGGLVRSAHDGLALSGAQLHGAQDGGKGRDPDPSTHDHEHIKAPDLLSRSPKRSRDLQHDRLIGQHSWGSAADQRLTRSRWSFCNLP